MRLSQELNDAFNQQVLHEYRNQLIYAQFESIFENIQLKGLSSYFHSQSQHEKEHGDKFLEHINSRTGGNVTLENVNIPPIPQFTAENMGALADMYVSTEEATTASIESIYELALNTKSYIDLPILAEMLKEQVEEEDAATQFALNIKMVKDLVLFDKMFKG